jgi:hypothetical protein
MQTHTIVRRRNRVYKSLHKPLTYLGVERTLFYFVCVGAVGAFNLFNSLIAGVAVFIGGFAFGQQIRDYLERTGRAGKEAAEIAAHSTRDRKEIHSPGEIMAAHRKLAADFGHQAEAVVRAARERVQHQEKPVNSLDRVRESLTFSRDKNFEREAVVDERTLIRDGLRRGMGEVTFAQVRGNLNSRLATGEFQVVERSDSQPARQFTTAKTVEAEHEIVRRVREGKNTVEPVMSRQQAIALTEQNANLNRSQKSVVEDVLSSPDRVQGVQGYAGTGKTTTLSAVRNAAESHGYAVEGFAPTSRAARQLGEAGIESGTLQGFLARTPNPATQPQRHFYFVDESSLASTNQVREFLSRLGPNDRALLIGDMRQHQGVEAGRPFEQLQDAGMPTASPALYERLATLVDGGCEQEAVESQRNVGVRPAVDSARLERDRVTVGHGENRAGIEVCDERRACVLHLSVITFTVPPSQASCMNRLKVIVSSTKRQMRAN